jgi:hypothetical protein
MDWTKYAPIRKVWAAIYVALLIGALAAIEALMGWEGLSELGLAGPVAGAALAALAAYLRRTTPNMPRSVKAASYPIDPDPGEGGDGQ